MKLVTDVKRGTTQARVGCLTQALDAVVGLPEFRDMLAFIDGGAGALALARGGGADSKN